MGFKKKVYNIFRNFVYKLLPELKDFQSSDRNFNYLTNEIVDSDISDISVLNGPYKIYKVTVGDYSYVGPNSNIWQTRIGKFCSIGANFSCGVGIHPTNGISTSPMFYANNASNGFVLSKNVKFNERKDITIGNDVWIGINVTILDGVTIGDGAIIAAGAVVTKNVPDYAIYGGIPAKHIKNRFSDLQINRLKQVKWWNFSYGDLQVVEKFFFEVDSFLDLHDKNKDRM